MKPVMKRFWINDAREINDGLWIRIDWSNDRHHAVKIMWPYSRKELTDALFEMGKLLASDKHLDPQT